MQAVKEYIFSLMIVSVCCGVAGMLVPDNSSVNRYVQFIISLIVTVMILTPVSSVIGVLPELIDMGGELSLFAEDVETMSHADRIIAETVENISLEVREKLIDKFSVEPADIEIECDSSDIENVKIDKITVIYRDNNKFLMSDTIKYISELFYDECEVVCVCEED